MKEVKAVDAYIYDVGVNFKNKPFEAWKNLVLPIAEGHYPYKIMHGFVFKCDFFKICEKRNEARLRFVQSWSLSFDTWPDYMFYEIIPFFWDVWPDNFERTCLWLKKYDVKTAIFTSSQIANMIKDRFPTMNVIAVTEGIDVELYKEGKDLKERKIDFLQYGREIDSIVKYDYSSINYISGKKNGKVFFSQEQLYDSLSNAKVVAAYPKSWTNPNEAGGIETLTQRYWECMLSRCVMIGHAPNELVELIGYNPVIELDRYDAQKQLVKVLQSIDSYQNLVDRNRDVAIKYGDWKYSVQKVVDFLKTVNYIV